MIENYQLYKFNEYDSKYGFCSHVVISDRYALTTSNCWSKWNGYGNDFNREKLRFIIRQDTEFEEVMNVKRFWINPWRRSVSTEGSAYYDIVIMEFGNFFVNISISVRALFCKGEILFAFFLNMNFILEYRPHSTYLDGMYALMSVRLRNFKDGGA